MKNTSSKIVYYVIKDAMEQIRWHRTGQRTECLRAWWGPLPVKFLVIANEKPS